MQTVANFLQVVSHPKHLLSKSKATSVLTANTRLVLLLFVIMTCLISLEAHASTYNKLYIQSVKICEGGEAEGLVTGFFKTKCEERSLSEVNEYDKLVWVGALFDADQLLMLRNKPLGLFISAKAAAEFYLNGQMIGRNGLPSAIPSDEIAGAMDYVTYLPANLLKAHNNELVIKLSSHHNLIGFEQLIQRIIISDYASPQNVVLRNYLPSFIPLGILLIGLVYTLPLVLTGTVSQYNLLLPLLTTVVMAQLVTELLRGLIAYNYPVHEIRVLSIFALGSLSGVCLLTYLAHAFLNSGRKRLVLSALCLTLAAVYQSNSIEQSTIFAIQIPAFICLALAVYATVYKRQSALAHAVALFIFSMLIAFLPGKFLDVYFYYFVSLLLLYFLVQHAIAYRNEKVQRLSEQSRADRLQRALDDYSEARQPTKIMLNHSGKVEWFSADQICFCKGARDYVEVNIADTKRVLHSESLSTMEEKLPDLFVRVHRSYLVNTHYVQSLEKSTSGGGILTLTTGAEIPVSRRIMPKVRKVLI
ncbi:hypothetical protein N480_05625 [Pseudoalteromonas luteoviolacea S2607]|nr:hypothetical protein N480_05625 [Pseudoalteromonas luteoviolacea S2607]